MPETFCAFHHIPCRNCSFCASKEYAQCRQYKQVGTTAGFEPAGGGFSQFVKVKDWIVKEGLVRIPDDVSAEEATFVEPVNTCLKVIRTFENVDPWNGERWTWIIGLGSIGLLLLRLARHAGMRVIASDPIPARRDRAAELGAEAVFAPDDRSLITALRDLPCGGPNAALVTAPSGSITE